MIKDKKGIYRESPVSAWFELTYAQFLTVPRLVLESMPYAWQKRMVELLDAMDKAFDWRPSEGRYWVRLRSDTGQFASAPLGNYRHGNISHLRRKDERIKKTKGKLEKSNG